MSFTQAPALSAISFQFAARLEQYEADMERMRACPTDPGLYHAVSGHMDQMRMYAAALPVVSVAWIEVLIRHFELAQAIWRLTTSAERSEPDLGGIVEQHRGAIRRLSSKCAKLMPRA